MAAIKPEKQYLSSPSRYSNDFNAYTYVFGVKLFSDVIANVA